MKSVEHQLQEAERLAAITQQIGFTLWQLQELEGVSAQYFVLLAQAHEGMGLNSGNVLVEKAQAKTFGSTVHQLVKAGLLSSELEARFTSLLRERNWLVHKSRASSRSAVHNDGAMQQLLVRLDVIAEESLSLLKAIGALIEGFVKQHGVSAQYIDESAQRILEQWHAADAL